MLDDATELTGTLSSTESAQLRIAADSAEEEHTIPMIRIAAINPPEVPWLSITGHVNAGLDLDRGNTDQDTYHCRRRIHISLGERPRDLGGQRRPGRKQR